MTPKVVDTLLGIWHICKCQRCGVRFCEPTCHAMALCHGCVELLIDRAPRERNCDEIEPSTYGCHRDGCGAAWSHYAVEPWRSSLHMWCTEGHWHTYSAGWATFWRTAAAILEVES